MRFIETINWNSFVFGLLLLIAGQEAIACDVSSLQSAADVGRAQACVAERIEEMSAILGEEHQSVADMLGDLKLLLNHEAVCIAMERQAAQNSIITRQMISNCQEVNQEFFARWSQSAKNFNLMLKDIKLSQDYIKALEMKLKELESVVGKFKVTR